MYSLLIKEITSFFNSLTGYVVIFVFLLATGLFLWVFDGNLNILETGYANLDPLFIIAPWVFLFLIPAITMKMFAEEKKTGTLELLLSRPVNEMQIILAKFIAALVLVIISVIPTCIYYFSVSVLGSPQGNLDTGAIMGSYTGLILLSGIYVSLGLFASAITDNQIVSFIIAVFLSFVFFTGFELLASVDLFSGIELFILKLGISEHYRSISRGVVDTRDIIYFISVIVIFLLVTKIKLQSRKW